MSMLRTRVLDAANAFYAQVFGWTAQPFEADGARGVLYRLRGYVGGTPAPSAKDAAKPDADEKTQSEPKAKEKSAPKEKSKSAGNGGRPNTGQLAQYAHPNLLTLIFSVERAWQAKDDRKFGIGNISIAGGFKYDDHGTHRKGIEMDIRPIRKDMMVGQAAHVTRFDAAYDREATIQLICLFAEIASKILRRVSSARAFDIFSI